MICRNPFMPYHDYLPSVRPTVGRVISITVSCDACHTEPELAFATLHNTPSNYRNYETWGI